MSLLSARSAIDCCFSWLKKILVTSFVCLGAILFLGFSSGYSLADAAESQAIKLMGGVLLNQQDEIEDIRSEMRVVKKEAASKNNEATKALGMELSKGIEGLRVSIEQSSGLTEYALSRIAYAYKIFFAVMIGLFALMLIILSYMLWVIGGLRPLARLGLVTPTFPAHKVNPAPDEDLEVPPPFDESRLRPIFTSEEIKSFFSRTKFDGDFEINTVNSAEISGMAGAKQSASVIRRGAAPVTSDQSKFDSVISPETLGSLLERHMPQYYARTNDDYIQRTKSTFLNGHLTQDFMGADQGLFASAEDPNTVGDLLAKYLPSYYAQIEGGQVK